MNIMLVSVTERTREIGIRLAIGAHEKHILVQFLVEATVLSLLGGLIGIALGLALAGAASYALSIPFSPSVAVILLAVGFSAAIGLCFGFFPALRGARLDPIEALAARVSSRERSGESCATSPPLSCRTSARQAGEIEPVAAAVRNPWRRRCPAGRGGHRRLITHFTVRPWPMIEKITTA